MVVVGLQCKPVLGLDYKCKTKFLSVFSGGRGLSQRKFIALDSPLPPEGSEICAAVADKPMKRLTSKDGHPGWERVV